jgi:hypothetical protein
VRLGGWAAVVAALSALTPTSACASPVRTLEPIRHGFQEQVGGVGCASAQVGADIRGSRAVLVAPQEGDVVGGSADVLGVAVAGGRVLWTVGPDAETCALNDSAYGAGNWSWSTWDDEVWEVVYRRRVYAIRASRYDGVKSIAGFRVSPRTRRSTPTVSRVKRAFVSPGSIRRGRGNRRWACTARWRRLGLTAVFVNYGLSPPCRSGYLQTVTISGPRATTWAAVIAGRPGTTPGTSLGFLERELNGDEDRFGRRRWPLSEIWLPYGDAGFYPAVSVRFSGRGHLRATDLVRGFELYIGAGGD